MLKQAHLAIKLRALLKADDWKAVVATLRGIADAMLKSMEEVEAAWSEVNDKCAEFEAALECALAAGRSKRVADGKAWDHGALSTTEVTAATASVRDFPHTTDKGKKLLSQSELVLTIRGALLAGCNWHASASWAALSKLLHAAPPETKELPEVVAAWQELADMRLKTEKDVSNALESGRSVRKPGGWDHSGVDTALLKAALVEADAFPAMSDVGRALCKKAMLVASPRAAFQAAGVRESTEVVEAIKDAAGREASEADEVVAAKVKLDEIRASLVHTLRPLQPLHASLHTFHALHIRWSSTRSGRRSRRRSRSRWA